MAKHRRGFDQFSLSFLDAMACGLGAVILIFMIINHASERVATDDSRETRENLSQLEEEILEKRSAAEKRAAALKETEAQLEAARKQAAALKEIIEQEDDSEEEVETTLENIKALKAEVEALEKQVDELEGQADEGDATRTFVGDGRRQYLTGLQVSGERILILVDASASMFDEKIVNIIRRRNMKDDQKRAAPKWKRALATVDWLTTQVPNDSQFQIYTFNTEVESVIKGTTGTWLSAKGATKLNEAITSLKKVIPENGTSLEKAFIAAAQLNPKPDALFLLTDGLPTQNAKADRTGTISGRQRERFYRSAVAEVPRDVPVNVILFPMEGDPKAAPLFWLLARATNGSLLAPTKDWP